MHLRGCTGAKKHIIMHSDDACNGQNRNIKTALTYLKLVQDPTLAAEMIDH
jgi:hypothetical protein